MSKEQEWEEWWSVFYAQVDEATIDRSTARMVWEYMNTRPKPVVVDDYSEHFIRIKAALAKAEECLLQGNMVLAEANARLAQDRTYKLCAWFNARMPI